MQIELTKTQQGMLDYAVILLTKVLNTIDDIDGMASINLHVFDDTSGQVVITTAMYDLLDAVQNNDKVYYVKDFQLTYEETDE